MAVTLTALGLLARTLTCGLCVAWGSFLMALKFKGILPKQKEPDGSYIVFYDLTLEVFFLISSYLEVITKNHHIEE